MKKEETTIKSIVEGQYKTSSACRLTSNEEFNRDAETMWEMKEMFMRMAMRKNQRPSARREKLYNVVFEYVKDVSKNLQRKNWGDWKNYGIEKPVKNGDYWVRVQGARAQRIRWESFWITIDRAVLLASDDGIEWSVIY